MFILKAYKFKAEPNQNQRRKLAQFAGSSRFVWNKALALQKETLGNAEKRLSYSELSAALTQWKKEESLSFLKDSPSHSLQNALKDLDTAYVNAWRRVKSNAPVCFEKKILGGAYRPATFEEKFGFPTFKKKGKKESFRESDPACFRVEGKYIKLPKIGFVKFRKSQEIIGTLRNVTVSQTGGHWFVSIQTQQEIEDPAHPSTTHTGIDMGVKRFATLSDGAYLKPLNSFKKLEDKLAKEQRKLSRKVKLSNNWKKQKAIVSRIHTKIANARKDYLHKASTKISKNHAMVVMEDLRVSNMSKSVKGTVENPGKSVKAKSGLNKAILDQGWFEFRRQLEYKQLWRGGTVVAVPPQHTSQRCFACGHTTADNRKNQETFLCVSCGYSAHADLSASKNILAVGQTVSACGNIRRIAA